MTAVSRAGAAWRSLRRYFHHSSDLGRYWKVPTLLVLYRMLVSRFRFKRDRDEFDSNGFARKPPREWDDYVRIPELFAMQQRAALEPALRFHLDKLLFARHCARHDLPTPAPLALLSATSLDDPLYIGSPEALARLFAARGEMDGFAKPLTGMQGHGGFAFAVRSGRLEPRPRFSSPEAFYDLCTRGQFTDDGYLLQERIHPHPELLPLMPGPGLGTIRIKTFLRRDGSVTFGMPILKVPAPGAEVDNTAAGSMMVAVDFESGVVQKALGALDLGTGRTITGEIERHQETGALFKGTQLPCWPEVRALMERAARAFPMMPALGWDVAISPAGPILVETNWFFAVGFDETVSGRGWRAYYREMYRDLAAPVLPD